MKILIIITILLAIIIAVVISKTTKSNNNFANNYLKKIQDTEHSLSIKDIEKKFLALYGDLKKGATKSIIGDTYADKLYFNDTFRTVHNLEDLTQYLIHTADATNYTTVKILDTAFSGTDYYIRWVMEMEFTAKGTLIHSKSIGMSQLRFNEQGKVIFHQDFWDNTEGFFQHLPYIGRVIRKIRSQL